jgi:hypothetical protein
MQVKGVYGTIPMVLSTFFYFFEDHGDSTTDTFLFAGKVFFRSVVYNALAAAMSYGDWIYQAENHLYTTFAFIRH